jgi:hypothetical protein
MTTKGGNSEILTIVRMTRVSCTKGYAKTDPGDMTSIKLKLLGAEDKKVKARKFACRL